MQRNFLQIRKRLDEVIRRKTFDQILKEKGYSEEQISDMLDTSIGEASSDYFFQGYTLDEYISILINEYVKAA